MSSLADKLVEVAMGEVGYLEKKTNSQLNDKTANAGNNNYTKYGAWYEGGWANGQAWCDIFVCWCANQVGILNSLIPRAASCGVTKRWYEQKGLWKKRTSGYTPKPGDLIIFSTSDNGSQTAHIGIVRKADSSRVYTVEGNTGGGSTVIANGGGVAAKSYGRNYARIMGYCSVQFPEDPVIKEEKYVPKKVNMKMNGKTTAVTAIVHEQENYVRLRDLTTLGLNVDYDKKAELPVIDLAAVENLKMNVEGKDIKVPNVQIAGTNYAGVRAFMEALGYRVDWDESTNTVICKK